MRVSCCCTANWNSCGRMSVCAGEVTCQVLGASCCIWVILGIAFWMVWAVVFSRKEMVTMFCPATRCWRLSMGSSATSCPLLMMTTRLQSCWTSCMMCVLKMTVFSCPRSLMSCRISTSWLGSSPEVGSSRMSTSGLCSMA